MSTSPLRAPMVPITRRVRAYFAPLNFSSPTQWIGTPTLFDPGKSGLFLLDAPPAPWIDLGWIDDFQRFCGTTTEALRTGAQGAPVMQYRGPLDVRLEFDFREWGKLQMALAGGSEHMNVLASDPNANAQPSGGTPLAAVAVLPGSTASEIVLGAGAVNTFSVGDIVAVDADYQEQTGYVGTGIAAAYVNAPADVNNDANYIRRVTFNLGRVAQQTATSLLLTQPLLGGAPPAGANAQKVVAFVDREGGSFFQEWSGLFVAEEESGGRVCFHYPRLSPTTALQTSMRIGASPDAATSSAKIFQRENAMDIAESIGSLALHAAFQAMPHIDENDGQTVLCYRSYFPASMAAVY
jgi:hypothetical protein